MFGKKKLRLFKIHYRYNGALRTERRDCIVTAKDEHTAIKEFYEQTSHVSCDITKIEEYEVEKIEG